MWNRAWWLLATASCVTALDGTTVIDEPVHTVIAELGKGDLQVFRGSGDRVVVEADVGGLGRVDGLSVHDGVLTVDYRCGGLDLCGADVALELPAGVTLDAMVGAGDVSLDALDGDLRAVVSAGSVYAREISGHDVHLAAAAGDVDAEFALAPGRVEAIVSGGHIGLVLPPGGYDLQLDARTGHVHTAGVHHDEQSGHAVVAVAGAGSIDVSGSSHAD